MREVEKEKLPVLEAEGSFNRRTCGKPFKDQFEFSIWLSRKSLKKDLEIMQRESKFRYSA